MNTSPELARLESLLQEKTNVIERLREQLAEREKTSGAIQDISELHESTQALRESEQRSVF